MATTSRPVTELALGIRDTAGAVVPSASVRFYNPGTLVAAVVYSDDVCTTPFTQPIVCNAGGQATVYTLEPVRMIAKNSLETITYYDGVANLNRHDAVYITHPDYNSGNETTLEAVLGVASASLGVGFQYRESATATARAYSAWMGEVLVSVKDFGATGDGTTDDTAFIQAASDRVEARGGGWLFFPKGTYKISSALTVDAVGVNWFGAGRGISIIRNHGTTTNTLTVNVGSSIDSKMTIRDLSITANTTSSGVAIAFTNGNRPCLFNVGVALHRSGFSLSAVSEAHAIDCYVESTDDNAAGVGVTLGVRGRAIDCKFVCGTTNGTGITLSGANAMALDCYVEKFSTAILTTTTAQARGCVVTGSAIGASSTVTGAANFHGLVITSVTTGINVSVPTNVAFCSVTTASTGYNVGATTANITMCSSASVTAALAVNAAGAVMVFPELTGGTVTNAGATTVALPWRFNRQVNDSGATTPVTVTPDITTGRNLQVFGASTGVAVAMTVAAHATATLAAGDMMLLVLYKAGANTITLTWNALYQDIDGSALTSATVAANTANFYLFWWDIATTKFKIVFAGTQAI